MQAFDAQLAANSEIGFDDETGLGQGEIAHRCKFVEVGITGSISIPRNFQIGLGLAQGFVLHFQFDLVHLKLVQQDILSGWIRNG